MWIRRYKTELAVLAAAALLLAALSVLLDVNSHFDTGLFDASPYNSYSLQAARWWQGHADLGRDYPHLEIAEYNGRYYVSFPPFPSVVMFFLVPLFGVNTPDRLISILCVLLAFLALAAFFKRRMDSGSAVFWAFFAAFGSNFVSLAVFSGVWFIAQTMSFCLCCGALWAADSPKRAAWPWAFAFLAMAVGCRPFQAFYFPVLIYILYRQCRRGQLLFPRRLAFCLPAPAVIAVCYMAYNCLRFGNPLEFGHNYLLEMRTAAHGQFSLSYLLFESPGGPGSNLYKILRLPWQDGRIYFPSFNGFLFVLANPIFLSVLPSLLGLLRREKRRERFPPSLLYLTAGLCLLHLLALLCHNTNGGWQFGARYTCDLLPFVLLLLFARGRLKPKRLEWALCAFAVALQCYGTYGWLMNWWS